MEMQRGRAVWVRLPCVSGQCPLRLICDHGQDLLRGCFVSWDCWDATPPGRAWKWRRQPTLLGRLHGQAPAGHFLFLVDTAPARTRLSSVCTEGLMFPWPSSEQEVLAISLPRSVPTGMCHSHQGPCKPVHLVPLWPPNHCLGMPPGT